MYTGLLTMSSGKMGIILLIFAAACVGNTLALNETPTAEITNNEIHEEVLGGNVVFDDKSFYSIENSTEAPATAAEIAPNDGSEVDENDDDQSEPEAEPMLTPVSDGTDNSITTESNTTEAEQNDQLVKFTDMLTTKLKQIANDFETLVDNDNQLVDVGKMTPKAEEKIEDELLGEIDSVMDLIPKEILEAIRNDVETPVDIEVTITYDDTQSLGKDEHTRTVAATNATAFTAINKAAAQENTVKYQKPFGPVCYLHRFNVPNAHPFHNYNIMSVPLMQARFRPQYYTMPATTPHVAPFQQFYATSAPLAPAMHTIGQASQPFLPQGLRRSHTSTESRNVFTGDSVVTEESCEESEVLRGPMAVHSVHSDMFERLIPAQHLPTTSVTPVQQYFMPRAA